jgi:competence protein ComFC
MLFEKELSILKEAIFPLFCIECDQEGALVCYKCMAKPEPAMRNHCPYCRRVTPYGASCARHLNRPLDGLIAIYPYSYSRVKALIRIWKYDFVREVEPLLYDIVNGFCVDQEDLIPYSNAVVSPVPLHIRRVRERGFDQANIIAHMFADSAELGKMDVLKRVRSRRRHQADIQDKKRRQSKDLLKDFMVTSKITSQNENVILVDDVYTTGATMSAAAMALKNAGVQTVWGFAIARAN